jgi:hypothetical protein
MAIEDIYGWTMSIHPGPNESGAFTTLTVYTPSDVVVQGAISIAGAPSFKLLNYNSWIYAVDIPGYGTLDFPNQNQTTVRFELNSITFASGGEYLQQANYLSTVLVALYSA